MGDVARGVAGGVTRDIAKEAGSQGGLPQQAIMVGGTCAIQAERGCLAERPRTQSQAGQHRCPRRSQGCTKGTLAFQVDIVSHHGGVALEHQEGVGFGPCTTRLHISDAWHPAMRSHHPREARLQPGLHVLSLAILVASSGAGDKLHFTEDTVLAMHLGGSITGARGHALQECVGSLALGDKCNVLLTQRIGAMEPTGSAYTTEVRVTFVPAAPTAHGFHLV
mmetsp:Transcript_21760/g.54411  ORF Transcript_21760/g.54411 Transcript_21760/m.54411 type:complete len:222 (+) Transcript_21760:372-1037(+)